MENDKCDCGGTMEPQFPWEIFWKDKFTGKSGKFLYIESGNIICVKCEKIVISRKVIHSKMVKLRGEEFQTEFREYAMRHACSNFEMKEL